MSDYLKFGNNGKMRETASMLGLNKTQVVNFDLPAGFTCPAAMLCQSYANRVTGKLTRGKHSEFECYAAKIERIYPTSRKLHWENFELIKRMPRDAQSIASLIQVSIDVAQSQRSAKNQIKVIRIHSSGDFFSVEYFQAWVLIAINNPEIVFFAYTKMLPLMNAERPSNFGMVYSYGGRYDTQWDDSIPTCFVITGDDNQYGDIKITCTDENPANDFYSVMAGETFGIRVH